MKLRDQVDVTAPAGVVWPYVADPAMQAKWNPQLASVDRQRTGPAGFGETFKATYHYGGDARLSHVDVKGCEPGRSITFRHRTVTKKPGRSEEWTVEESYVLEPHGDGVCVMQTIDLSNAVPWWGQLIIRFIRRFGTPSDELFLQRMKRLVEADLAKVRSPSALP